jgi:hypothetical protein
MSVLLKRFKPIKSGRHLKAGTLLCAGFLASDSACPPSGFDSHGENAIIATAKHNEILRILDIHFLHS